MESMVSATETIEEKTGTLLQGLLLAKSLRSCLTLCDPTDGSPPGPTVRGSFQARVPEWGAFSAAPGELTPNRDVEI